MNAFARREPDAFLVLVISTVLVFTPPVAALVMGSYLRLDWGNPLFFLVPLTVLVLIPRLVTRRAVARAGIVATAFTLILLIAAPIYPWVNYRLRPVGGAHAPYHEIAEELTKVWRARFRTPLPIVVGGYEVAAYVVFYSPDHPKMYADFDPALSPWIDYPNELKRKGLDRRVRDLRGGLPREAGRTRSEGREAGNFGHAPDRRRERRHDDLRIADFSAGALTTRPRPVPLRGTAAARPARACARR